MSSFHSGFENGIYLSFIDLPGFHPNSFSRFYLTNAQAHGGMRIPAIAPYLLWV